MNKRWSAALALMGLAGTLAPAAAETVRVNVGIANSATDAALFVADRKGHF